MLGWRQQFQPPSGRITAMDGRIPIPMLGVNAQVPLSRMSPDHMPYAYNIYSSEQGLYTREGYREHATGHGAAVRTLMAYDDPANTADRLFSITPDAIYDITTTTASPSSKVAFGSQAGSAGWGVGMQYRNDAGDTRLLYADGENGLHVYDPTGDTWALETGITGIAEADVRFVMNHKVRIWLAVKDSAIAYYLPAGAYLGAATSFNFAAQFPRGGNLVGMWSWTIDGGAGIDDLFVAMASSGDVVVYQGDDPSSAADWELVGKWNIGELPEGRTLGGQIGGELHLLSKYGVVSLNDLLRGVDVARLTGQTSIARNVVRPIRNDMATRSDDHGWQFLDYLSEGFLLLTRPIVSGSDIALQYVFNLSTNSWGFFRGPPMQCGVELNGVFYFGDRDGAVHYFTGSLDGVDRAGDGGIAVDFSLLTSYQDMGSPGRHKIGLFTRPTFIVPEGNTPAYSSLMAYDYSLNEATNTGIPTTPSGDVWDTATWDNAIWGGENEVGFLLEGSTGMGRVLAVAIRGSAAARTRLIDIDLMWRPGGFL